jgi:Competence protein J (ComJ)
VSRVARWHESKNCGEMMANFTIPVSYNHLAVFLSDIPRPYNNWTDRHVKQGFSWRPGSVSFRTLDDGDVSVSVSMQQEPRENMQAERIICVPFSVHQGAIVEMGSILATVPLEILSGDYALTFEHGRTMDGELWCALNFRPTSERVQARVIRADPGLAPEDVLLMSAEPA